MASDAPIRPGDARVVRTEHWFSSSQHSHKLNLVRWRSSGTEKPRAVVFFSHGYSNYASSVFAWLASHLVSRGIEACALELLGHGKSGGMPGYTPDFRVLVCDFIDSAKAARAAWYAEDIPLFAHGESMGGAICIQAARAEPALFAGLLLYAPMTAVDAKEQPHFLIEAAGRLVAMVAPWAPITPLRDIQAACFKDPERLPEARKDTVRYAGAMRIGTALTFKDTILDIQARAGPELRTPYVLYHGTSDVVTSPAGSAALHAAAASPHKTLVEVQDGWHVLWFEPRETRIALFNHMMAWIEDRVAHLGVPDTQTASTQRIGAAPPGSVFRGPPGDEWTPWTNVSHPDMYAAQHPDEFPPLPRHDRRAPPSL